MESQTKHSVSIPKTSKRTQKSQSRRIRLAIRTRASRMNFLSLRTATLTTESQFPNHSGTHQRTIFNSLSSKNISLEFMLAKNGIWSQKTIRPELDFSSNTSKKHSMPKFLSVIIYDLSWRDFGKSNKKLRSKLWLMMNLVITAHLVYSANLVYGYRGEIFRVNFALTFWAFYTKKEI